MNLLKGSLLALVPLALVLVLAGSTKSAYPKKEIGIIHDYVIAQANSVCNNHGGLHYIVSVEEIFNQRTDGYKGDHDDYPCTDKPRIRCQDGTLVELNTGVGFCFISVDQVQETLNEEPSERINF